MTIPLELTFANILAISGLLVAVLALLTSRRGVADVAMQTKLDELEVYHSQKIGLMDMQLKVAQEDARRNNLEAEVQKMHTQQCERSLREAHGQLDELRDKIQDLTEIIAVMQQRMAP